MPNLKIAVCGCSHGEMDKIYDRLAQMEYEGGFKVELLICCGDYQSVRNYADLECMACPPKYRSLQTFYKYYSGERRAPVLTIFIGGNHEASSYLSELPYGGWVAPNIWYMGFANVVQFKGVRIAGLSGIYNYHHYHHGNYETTPYSGDTMRSAYHVRSLHVFRMKQLQHVENKLDVMFGHDWPNGITQFGNSQWLFRVKKFLREDAERNRLGNPYTMQLLNELQPAYFFAAHLHVRFEAHVQHAQSDNGRPQRTTRFLALDKPIPQRHFLEIVDIDVSQEQTDMAPDLCYDPTWLCVLRNTDHLWHLNSSTCYMPGETPTTTERWDFRPTTNEIDVLTSIFTNDFRIPHNFRMTAPPHRPTDNANMFRNCQSLNYRNPQTTEFATKVGVLDVNRAFFEISQRANMVGEPFYTTQQFPQCTQSSSATTSSITNPDIIDLDEDADFCCANEQTDVVDHDSAYFDGNADFVIDKRPQRAKHVHQQLPKDDPFVPPPLKRHNMCDETQEQLCSSSVNDESNGNDNDRNTTTTTTSSTTTTTSNALSRMKRRNVDEYKQKADEDDV